MMRNWGFDGLDDVEAIEERLMLIVQQKLDDVVGQLASAEAVVLCADTIVVAEAIWRRVCCVGEAAELKTGRPVNKGLVQGVLFRKGLTKSGRGFCWRQAGREFLESSRQRCQCRR